MRLKQGKGWHFTGRDVFGIMMFIFTLLLIFSDKNIKEAFYPKTSYDKIDRVVTYKIVTEKDGLIKNAIETVEKASENLEKNFGIKLVYCGINEVWKDKRSIADLDRLDKQIINNPCDIVIAFTDRPLKENNGCDERKTFGIASSDAVITTSGSIPPRSIILAHEIAHLFGATHIDEDGFIMAPVIIAEPSQWKWDDWNKKIIIYNKYRNFDKYDFLYFWK